MAPKKLKFLIGPAVIVLAVIWMAYSAFDTMAYFQTVSEFHQMKGSLGDKNLKVAGEVVPGSINRQADAVTFVIHEGGQELTVRYVGLDPLPDTFRDYAEAVVDGRYAGNNVFTATKLQAKCASKYEREMEAGVNPSETTQLQPAEPASESGF